MSKYYKYLRYVVKHKYFVLVGCIKYFLLCLSTGKLKFGLLYRGIIHDCSKFRFSEFLPYARYFFGSGCTINKGRDRTGYYKPTDTGNPSFEFAWFLHTKRNKHHWQYWVIPEKDKVKPIYIPLKYVEEMVCDWFGASKAQNSQATIFEWYDQNKDKLNITDLTRYNVEAVLARFKLFK